MPPKTVCSDLQSVRAVPHIDRDSAPGARHTCTDLFVRAFLRLAEEDVTVIKLTVDLDDVDGANTTLAAPATQSPRNRIH